MMLALHRCCGTSSALLFACFIVFSWRWQLAVVFAAWDTCERIDGDCPDDCHAAGFNGTLGFTARLSISPTHPAIQAAAKRADEYITSHGTVQVGRGVIGKTTSVL